MISTSIEYEIVYTATMERERTEAIRQFYAERRAAATIAPGPAPKPVTPLTDETIANVQTVRAYLQTVESAGPREIPWETGLARPDVRRALDALEDADLIEGFRPGSDPMRYRVRRTT